MFQPDTTQYGLAQVSPPFPTSHRKPPRPSQAVRLFKLGRFPRIAMAGLFEGERVSPVTRLPARFYLASHFDVPVLVILEARSGMGGFKEVTRYEDIRSAQLISLAAPAEARVVVRGYGTGRVEVV